MLFWPSPDESRMAQRIRARWAASPRNDPALLDAQGASMLLKGYFAGAHKWDGNYDTVDISIPVDQLPPELRPHVEAAIYREVITRAEDGVPGPGAFEPNSKWWKETRLVVELRSRVPRGSPTPFLTTPTRRVRGGIASGMIIGRLGFLDRR